MMFELLFYSVIAIASISVVGSASTFLNGSLQRGFAGVSTYFVSSNFLLNYTNTESFIRACVDGKVGIAGYAFVLALATLIIVWVNNVVQYRQAIM
jgi:hypothetical protein